MKYAKMSEGTNLAFPEVWEGGNRGCVSTDTSLDVFASKMLTIDG